MSVSSAGKFKSSLPFNGLLKMLELYLLRNKDYGEPERFSVKDNSAWYSYKLPNDKSKSITIFLSLILTEKNSYSLMVSIEGLKSLKEREQMHYKAKELIVDIYKAVFEQEKSTKKD